jgi:hypothetical protein
MLTVGRRFERFWRFCFTLYPHTPCPEPYARYLVPSTPYFIPLAEFYCLF